MTARERLAAVGAALDVVAFPQTGELPAVEEEFTGEPGQVGGLGGGAGQGAQPGHAAADLVFQSWNTRSRVAGWRKA